MRDRIGDPFAIWVEQVTITERDEQPVPADYNLRISSDIRVIISAYRAENMSEDHPYNAEYALVYQMSSGTMADRRLTCYVVRRRGMPTVTRFSRAVATDVGCRF